MAAEVEVRKESWLENARSYVADIRSEMKRVTWPGKLRVQSTTLVVIVFVFACAAYFKVVDTVIENTITRGYTALVK